MLSLSRREVLSTSPLLKWAKDATSQGGEDGIVERLLGVLDLPVEQRFVVEVGAWDGQHLSNTFSLLHKGADWSGLLLEANSERSSAAALLYKDNPRVTCLAEFVKAGPAFPHFLESHGVPFDFGFLVIDIDGNDYHIWQSIETTAYRPALVVIEFNPSIPNVVSFVQEDDAAVQKGSSLRAIRDLGLRMGYRLVVTTSFNAFFVLDKHWSKIAEAEGIPANSLPPSLHDLNGEGMCTWVFQTYDGELVWSGVRKLLWQQRAINPQQLQVLKKKERMFPFAPPTAREEAHGKETTAYRLASLIARTNSGSDAGLGELLGLLRDSAHSPQGLAWGDERRCLDACAASFLLVLWACHPQPFPQKDELRGAACNLAVVAAYCAERGQELAGGQVNSKQTQGPAVSFLLAAARMTPLLKHQDEAEAEAEVAVASALARLLSSSSSSSEEWDDEALRLLEAEGWARRGGKYDEEARCRRKARALSLLRALCGKMH